MPRPPVPHAFRARIRPAQPADVDALMRIEQRAFASEQIPRRGLRRFLASPSSALIVATRERTIAGYALVLFRANSEVARLYSIAVAPEAARRGIGAALLAAAEKSAIARGCGVLRLEVHEKNAAAVSLYRKAGYVNFGRYPDYYAHRDHALRFEKRLTRRACSRPSRSAFALRAIAHTLRPSGGGNTSRSSRR